MTILTKRRKALLQGISTYIPIINRYYPKKRTGGTNLARYCYSVWLRHLVMAKNRGFNTQPSNIAELGPGDSLGIGLSALISGSDKYFAFDIVDFTDIETNIILFEEILSLFKNRTPIPGEDEFPKLKPYLKSYSFPSDILSENRLKVSLEDRRIDKLRSALISNNDQDNPIQFYVPWYRSDVIRYKSVDMIYSQAVLEHIDDLQSTYNAFYKWLKPSVFMSHQLDFKCHGKANEWNGHWTYSDLMWKLIRGRRPFLLNREPYSNHISILKDFGFKIAYEQMYKSESKINRNDLASRFRFISDVDIVISEAFIQATS